MSDNRRPNGPNNRPPKNKKVLFSALAAAGLLAVMFNMNSGNDNQPAPTGPAITDTTTPSQFIPYSDFMDRLESGNIEQVYIQNQDGTRVIAGKMEDGSRFETLDIGDPGLVSNLEESGVEYTKLPDPPEKQGSLLLPFLFQFGPILLIIGFVIWKMKQQGRGGMGMNNFGGNKAKLLTETDGKVTFDDVAGIDEAKEELQEVVDFLKDPSKYQHLGASIPKGVLLVGPPGTGKTLTARAVAGEAGVPFYRTSGSDFVEMFVGVGASRVRKMFEEARKNAPCIIFVDEIDAVGRHRGAGMGGGNDEREQTLNQLLVEMDGFDASEGVILVAATNRPDVLDPALLRPGRFDRQVVVPNPDLIGREKILKVHMRKVPLATDVDTRVIARGTPGFSGADLANLVNEAALLTARRGKKEVGMAEFEEAKDKIMMGPERRNTVMSEEEKKLTAYHEAGHAVVSYFEDGCDPIHKATIIPRGRALGMVMSLPERDRVSVKYSQLTSMLAMAYGGRVAEELKFGKDNITTGASGDIQQATKMARAMVTQYGYSDKLGRIQFEGNEQEVFLGHAVAQKKNVSEATQQLIDQEVKRLTDEGEAKARDLLTTHSDAFERLAQALLEYETLDGSEVGKVIRGEPVGRDPSTPPAGKPTSNDNSPGTSVPTVPRKNDFSPF